MAASSSSSSSWQALARATARFSRSWQQPARRALATHAPATASASTSTASSSSTSSHWSPPIAPGTCPAYDEALAYISRFQATKQKRIAELQSDDSHGLDAQSKAELIDSLVVASQINDPKVRWAYEHTADDALDLNDPTTRHLREKSWRQLGSLDKLIERIRDQHVIPDSISHLTPTVDVQVIIGSVSGPGIGDHTSQEDSASGEVLPGVLLEQRHLLEPPTIRLTSFSKEEKKYALFMLDLDMPVDASPKVWPMWIIDDITLSCTKPRLLNAKDTLGGKVKLPYTPPHPAQGSGRHRYTFLLFEKPDTASDESIWPDSMTPKVFAARELLRPTVERAGLSPAGVHFYRSQWTEASQKTISKVWKERRGEEEPRYGKVPRREIKRLTYEASSW